MFKKLRPTSILIKKRIRLSSILLEFQKSGSWDLGSRTFFWQNPDIFGWDQKYYPINVIWIIFLLKMKHKMIAIDLKWINESFRAIFNNKIIFINELFTKIWKSDIFIPKLGSRTFFVFLELWLIHGARQDLEKSGSVTATLVTSSLDRSALGSVISWGGLVQTRTSLQT